MIALMGHKLFPFNLYTATFRRHRDDHKVTYDFEEFYFNSRVEAHAFLAKRNENEFISVRPGGRILSDSLLRQLKDPKDSWQLTNQLLRRITAGMIALNEKENSGEDRLNRLASSGVAVSWLSFLANRTRKQLIAALDDCSVVQGLRYELMEALLQVQRLHLHDSRYLRL